MTDRGDPDYRSLPDYRTGQPEYRGMSPQEWIHIIIDKCGLSRDVQDCLAKQLEQFERYTIDWVKRQQLDAWRREYERELKHET